MLTGPELPFWQAVRIHGTAPRTLSARNSRRFIFRGEIAFVLVMCCTNNVLYLSSLCEDHNILDEQIANDYCLQRSKLKGTLEKI